ncbi:multidrug resistance efflux pump [Nonlabens dokdonensis]|uniref:Multidrug resistance efflux pump n=2 Tax=Nonlabens dokdonensis TaxID=328515 RepID=A0ABX5PW97_9FLAO|nr:HlyD family efflux transporter periplasmic adaptor subunit [Nonlabens dokdonensis]AGC75169.1 putative membrane fusion protein, efflux [Nonlabens dokdonensis DSW-6]PZX39087.1 multidrug resistance efflux pump [Nonlabens dokdonensis]
MLNISNNPMVDSLSLNNFKAGRRVHKRKHYKLFNRFLGGFAIFAFILLFFPWTQNINGKGFVTTLTPAQRPLTLQSPIAGQIEEWYVREGDRVKLGDTILRISEVKSEYMDPNIVARTGQQIDAKSASVQSYREKIKALDGQIGALNQERELKLDMARNKYKQAEMKIIQDSTALIAAINDQLIAQKQYVRTDSLLKFGIKSPAEVEDKSLKAQSTLAKRAEKEQKLLQSKNELINAEIEVNRIRQEYAEKIQKARSDQFTAQSSQLGVEAEVSKLETDRTNYQIRNDLYFVTAPQDGYLNKAIKAGKGETFKEGEPLINIMPLNYDLAVETFVDPIDLPLIHVGEKVRVQFDGWPAIIFSGWPNASYGTYGAEVIAVETFITEGKGKYRILLAPDEEDNKWPDALRPGSGAYTIALLEDVPIWYEIWRQLNGFPPNYYTPETSKKGNNDKK